MPTPQRGQYLMHVHNHITPALAAVDSCFALIGANQHGKALDNTGRENLHIKDLLLPKRVQSTPLSNSWLGTAKAKQLSHSMHMEMGSEKLTCVPPKILKQPNVTLNRILATFVMEQKSHVRTTR